MIDSVLVMAAVAGLVGSPYLLTIAIVFASLAFIAFVSLRMKDVIIRIINFFNGFKTEVTDIKTQVNTIRNEQKISTISRLEMATKLDALNDRMDDFSKKGKSLKHDVDLLKSFHRQHCSGSDDYNKFISED